jgi:hypothetical protein
MKKNIWVLIVVLVLLMAYGAYYAGAKAKKDINNPSAFVPSPTVKIEPSSTPSATTPTIVITGIPTVTLVPTITPTGKPTILPIKVIDGKLKLITTPTPTPAVFKYNPIILKK